jgi:signal peptidase I
MLLASMITVDLSVTTELLIQSLQEGARPFLTVTSNSMTPLIRQSDEIQVALTNQQELDVGDIIVVGDADGFLAHRYWSTFSSDGASYLVLRGDRLKNFDPPYPAAQLIGRVIARRRNKHTLDISHGIGRRLNLLLKDIAAFAVPLSRTHKIETLPLPATAYQGTEQSIRVARQPIFGSLFYTAQILTLVVDTMSRFLGLFGRG